jgi:hypothetical protein
MDNKRIREMVRKVLKEMSMTGGSATFTPGAGAQYATPNAFNPNKKAKGTAHNYYLKLGFKLVDRSQAKHSKAMDYKNLWK